ncbi:MAG: hypothetical protein KKG47_00560 [Proteobacteria bacterium]|nr:hypothetical protein [Pseudomonadota bacterium]MBU1737230.1 hypothetical protein [Pseudomonadota bacterium]
MQRQNKQPAGKEKISPTKVGSGKSGEHLPRASAAKSGAKKKLVVSLNDANLSRLLMHDDVDLLERTQAEDRENFAELLDGAFSDQSHSDPAQPGIKKQGKIQKVRRSPRGLLRADQPLLPEDPATPPADQSSSWADQTISWADQTLSVAAAMFRPAKVKTKNRTGQTGIPKARGTGRVRPPENLGDQTLILADQTLRIVTSALRPAKEKKSGHRGNGEPGRRTDPPGNREGVERSQVKRVKSQQGERSESRVERSADQANQTTSWADKTMKVAASMFRPAKGKAKDPADQTLGVVASIFRPVKEVKLDANEDLYFGRKGRVNIDYSVMQAAATTKYSLLAFFFCVGVVLGLGWLVRGEELLSAESGLGYIFGIIGGTMMLVLVFYPLRKKNSRLKFLGPVKFWFYLHMIFGTLGPAFVLFHANFSVGSFNSQVALTFTMLVAASGFFHMYIYTRVHYRLHGKKITLQELQKKTEVNRSSLNHIFTYAPKLKQRLHQFEEEVLAPPHSVLESILRVLTIGLRTRLNYLIIIRGLKRGLKIVFERAGWPESEMEGQHQSNMKIVRDHMKAILKIVELSFYERLFAQWYLFHGPLFFMLIFVAIIHVIAVHMY